MQQWKFPPVVPASLRQEECTTSIMLRDSQKHHIKAENLWTTRNGKWQLISAKLLPFVLKPGLRRGGGGGNLWWVWYFWVWWSGCLKSIHWGSRRNQEKPWQPESGMKGSSSGEAEWSNFFHLFSADLAVKSKFCPGHQDRSTACPLLALSFWLEINIKTFQRSWFPQCGSYIDTWVKSLLFDTDKRTANVRLNPCTLDGRRLWNERYK